MRWNLSWSSIDCLSSLLGILRLVAMLRWRYIIIHGWISSSFLITLFELRSLRLIIVLLKHIYIILWLVYGLFTPLRRQWILISLLLKEMFILMILALHCLWNDSLIQRFLRRDHLNLIIVIGTRFYHRLCAGSTPVSMAGLLFEFESHSVLVLFWFLETCSD